jgi:TM2 domain-containing membrane protein YozV
MENIRTMTQPSHSLLLGYLFWILGFLGSHRFYYGKRLTGILYLFTGGLLLIGWIIDLVLIPGMNDEADERYRSGPYDYSIAWLLHAFLGFFGTHHFYLGQWILGLVYLFTGGIFGLGYLYDWLTLNEQIDQRNAEAIRL